MIALLLVAQSVQWSVNPPVATVGDTVTVERVIDLNSAGVHARVSSLEPTAQVEPLRDPEIFIEAAGIRIRHTIAVFAPGTLRVDLPDIELLHQSGEFETATGGSVTIFVGSVLPALSDSVPTPRPSRAPIGRTTTNPRLAVLLPLAVVLLTAMWGGLRRRRRQRPSWEPSGPDIVEPPVERWIQAGEPRAVAALAMSRVRERLQELSPNVKPAMSNAEVLDVVRANHPEWPVGQLSDSLLSLERASFAPAVAADVMVIVESAERALRAVEEARAVAPVPGDG